MDLIEGLNLLNTTYDGVVTNVGSHGISSGILLQGIYICIYYTVYNNNNGGFQVLKLFCKKKA